MNGDPSPDQRRALDQIEAWISGPYPENRYFTVFGLAGVGKSWVAARIAQQYRGTVLTAPTGKAAAVLRARTGLNATTIHSAIYFFQGLLEDEDDEWHRKRPVFVPNEVDRSRQLIIADESSMIGSQLGKDLLATGARVLAFGDPGQLAPVRDSQFFTKADATLTQIHRQALDSAVVRQAHAVRSSGCYSADGEDFRITCRATDEDLNEVDVALTWRNRTRGAIGERRRNLRGFSGPVVRATEPLVCGRNNHRLGIFNGEIYSVIEDREPGTGVVLDVNGREVYVRNALIEGIDFNYHRDLEEDKYAPFTFGYALTIHRAQGSEWERVLVVDEIKNNDERNRLLYTGFTRAKKGIVVVKAGKKDD